MLNYDLLPKKLNDICYFKNTMSGTVFFSFSEKVEQQNLIIIAKLDDKYFDRDFAVSKSTIEMLYKLQAEEIKLTDKSFIIKGPKGKYTSKLIDIDLPAYHIPKENKVITNIKYLNKAAEFTSNESANPILMGVYCDTNAVISATDSFKAYYYKNLELEPTEKAASVIIPTNFIKCAYENFGEVELAAHFDDQTIAVAKDNIIVLGTLFKGNYPNLERLFSTTGKDVCVKNVDHHQLNECLNLSKNCSHNEIKDIIAKLSDNKFSASGDNEYESIINFDTQTKCYLSGKKLADALRNLDNEYSNWFIQENKDNKQANMVLIVPETTGYEEKILLLGIRE